MGRKRGAGGWWFPGRVRRDAPSGILYGSPAFPSSPLREIIRKAALHSRRNYLSSSCWGVVALSIQIGRSGNEPSSTTAPTSSNPSLRLAVIVRETTRESCRDSGLGNNNFGRFWKLVIWNLKEGCTCASSIVHATINCSRNTSRRHQTTRFTWTKLFAFEPCRTITRDEKNPTDNRNRAFYFSSLF